MTEYTKDEYVDKISDRLSISAKLLAKFPEGDLKSYFNRSVHQNRVGNLNSAFIGLGAIAVSAFCVGLPIVVPVLLAAGSFASGFGWSYYRSGNERVLQEITARAGDALPMLPAPGK